MFRSTVGAVCAALTVVFIVFEVSAAPSGAFKLTSQRFVDGGTMPMSVIYTEAGGSNVSPSLSWRDAPRGTKSFALTVYDPDAHGGWWHWIAINIPSSVRFLPDGYGDSDSKSVSGRLRIKNSFGNQGYSGPCPPVGDRPHHYIFTLYALNVPTFAISSDEKPSAISADLKMHSLGQAVLVGRYGR